MVIVLIIVLTLAASGGGDEEPVDTVLPVDDESTEPRTCVVSVLDPHLCTCPGDTQSQPLIIAGDSVKILNKAFSPAEIEWLKTDNYPNTYATYPVFEDLDRSTLACEKTIGSTHGTRGSGNAARRFIWKGQMKDD